MGVTSRQEVARQGLCQVPGPHWGRISQDETNEPERLTTEGGVDRTWSGRSAGSVLPITNVRIDEFTAEYRTAGDSRRAFNAAAETGAESE